MTENTEKLTIVQDNVELRILHPQGREFLRIGADGTITISGDIYEAARAFWEVVRTITPSPYKFVVRDEGRRRMTSTTFAAASSITIWTFQVEWKGKPVLMVYDGCCGPRCNVGEHDLEKWYCEDPQDAVLWCTKCDSYGRLLAHDY